MDRLEKQRHHTDSGKTIFVQGLPEEWTNSDILQIFQTPEEVVEIRIQETHKRRRTEEGNKVTQVCYVDMVSKEAAQRGR